MATAVPAERDAVARAFPEPGQEVRLPGAVLFRTTAGAGPSGTTADAAPRRTAAVIDLLAAGVGPARAAAATGAALTAAALAGAPYDLVVSAGIGGGFAPGAPLGSLVVADAITVADLGAETADGFLPVTELGFGAVTHRPPESLVRAVAEATGARTGTVLTVSTVTGTAARAAALRTRHPRALAEGMEGFGVAEAANAQGVPVLEVRAISNPVGPRDRAAWRIGDALAALTAAFGKFAPALESWKSV
ncbi:futalosine hydrolase [Streptomyces griseofuscus]|uniref:Futalosine hydrolase n=1 Tax=Streptomyces griseofuscus TaxID=146922 RepID=A0A426S2B8_9ACTN|nr:futalosine hydrolase [Streptomyces griseofuscus]RRQ83641.1 futalosine hydrolase [Streptomyces griseofuscus]